MMQGSNQGQGPNDQSSALGMNSLHVGPVGSPMMNRMEGGGEQGVERPPQAAVISQQVLRREETHKRQ